MRYASITVSWRSSEKISVTLTVMPDGDGLLDRGDALERRRDLDHHVGPVDAAVQVARRRDRAVGVVRERGRDLERHEAVAAAVARRSTGRSTSVAATMSSITTAQYVSSIDSPCVGALGELLVVALAGADGLVEDRRVRRDAADAVDLDELLEPTAGERAGGRGCRTTGSARSR